MMAERDLKNMDIDELKKLVAEMGEEEYRATQIFKWIYKGIKSIDEMTDLPKSLKEKLKADYYITSIEILERVRSGEDTVKYAFKLEDGNVIESVLMGYRYGYSVCVSSQVGCGMGCLFCASTIGGVVRNLKASEMVDQVLKIGLDIGCRISNVVIMGSGEPLLNFDEVVKFIKLLNSKEGLNIGMRHITISTCGIVPGIRRLAVLKLPITLSVSLHAPTDVLRERLMPINRKYPIRELMEVCRYYIKSTGRRITFEYVLIEGINDKMEDARMLAKLLKGMLCNVNLIPLNVVEERPFKRPSKERVLNFRNILMENGINVTIRREMGIDINAACGQLRRRLLKNLKEGE